MGTTLWEENVLAVGENALVVGEEGRKTESSPQVREVSGRSAGEF